MAQQFRYLSAYNGYLPKETGMVVGFIRKPENFALNKWVQYIPTPAPLAAYNVLGFDESVRIPLGNNTTVVNSAFSWEDGDPRPMGDANKHQFQLVPFRTLRFDYPWTLGYESIENASWKPKLVHMDDSISRAMTARTLRVVQFLEQATNWVAAGTSTQINVAAANTLNGGHGNFTTASDDPGNPNYNAIMRTLLAAARQINLATNARVKMKDFRVVLSPGLAIAMAETPELTNYVRESPVAMQMIKQGFSDDENLWGLPERYKGFQMVVEDAPIVYDFPNSSGTEATVNRQYIKPDNTAYMLSRPGGLDGTYGSKSYSTIQLYHYGALLEVEVFDDPRNRRVDGHVTENIREALPVPQSGYLIQATA